MSDHSATGAPAVDLSGIPSKRARMEVDTDEPNSPSESRGGGRRASTQGGSTNPWERAFEAMHELAEARKAETALQLRLAERERRVTDLKAQVRTLSAERDGLVARNEQLKAFEDEAASLRDEVARLRHLHETARAPPTHQFRGPAGPSFRQPPPDNGWGGRAGRGGAPGHVMPRAPPPNAPNPPQPTVPPAPLPGGPTQLDPILEWGAPATEPWSFSSTGPVPDWGAEARRDEDVDMAGPSHTREGWASSTGPPAHASRPPSRAHSLRPGSRAPSAGPPASGPRTRRDKSVTPGPAGNPPGAPPSEAMDVDLFEFMTPAEREIARIEALQWRPDPNLESSGQPKSAWYNYWLSKVSMAEALAALGLDDFADDQPGVSTVLPDPIETFKKDMTAAAQSTEVMRAAKKATPEHPSSGAPAIVPGEEQYGGWKGTSIVSVVQAHNLRWLATVEVDDEAVQTYRFVMSSYKPAYRVRPPGVRYLQRWASVDGPRVKGKDVVIRHIGTPRTTLGRYPPATANEEVAWRFFRGAPTGTWPVGLRLANGDIPPPNDNVYRVPHLADALAYTILWHIIPERRATNPHHVHDERFRTLAIELFSIAGWYEWIVMGGDYASVAPAAPTRYPYSTVDITHVHVAAWFAVHGLALSARHVDSLQRWGRLHRNLSAGSLPLCSEEWPSAPTDLAAVTTTTLAAEIVPYDAIAWGEKLDDAYATNLLEDEALIDCD